MEGQSQLETAWEQAKDGQTVDGRIDLGDAYISYETESVGDSRYFKIWIGMEDEYVDSNPPAPVRQAYGTVLSVIPDADLLPESGEMYSAVKL